MARSFIGVFCRSSLRLNTFSHSDSVHCGRSLKFPREVALRRDVILRFRILKGVGSGERGSLSQKSFEFFSLKMEYFSALMHNACKRLTAGC